MNVVDVMARVALMRAVGIRYTEEHPRVAELFTDILRAVAADPCRNDVDALAAEALKVLDE